MATNLGRVKATAASKHDAFVSSQLKQAETRIRMLDLTAGLLGFAALSLVYILGMVLCDSKLLLSQHTRQLSLYAFLAGAAVYLYFAVLRPLSLRVNPYYAARQVEQQLPQAKNSIVNWVDLHEQPLPSAIRSALGQRAAKDLSRVDLERTISGRRAYLMGGLAGLFAFAFILSYLLLGPAPFMSLLKRTFNPFEAVGVSSRTRLTLLKPEGGNATLTVGRGISFVVDVGGKVPDPKSADAVKLLYRYEEGDPWLERRLVQEANGDWAASLSAIEVKNGFWYKITGGDAETEEYQVSVRAAAAITDFLATYHFRPYVARPDEVRRERELKALRGTEILLHVRTNRTLREGRLEFESNGRTGIVNPASTFVRGEVDAKEPNTFLVRFILNEDGKYRLGFTSVDGEAFRDPSAYTVTAIPDQPPAVELTNPGKDIRLRVDALLQLEGKASDDIGVRSLILQMRVIGGDKLRGQPYRPDEQLRLADGGYPCELEYKDFVELSRVQSEDGRPVKLRGGMELEYWLEVSDACDYLQANVTESKHYRVLLTEPDKNDPKKNQEKTQAQKEKKQHEQKQNQKLQKENQQRQQERQEQQARNKEEENKSKNADKNNAGEKSQSKESGQANDSEGKQESGKENKGQQGEGKQGSGESNSGDQKSELSKDNQTVEDKIKKALEKKQSGKNSVGESKPEKGDQGQGKDAQQNKPVGGDGAKSENNDSGKDDGKQGSEGKEKGQSQAGGNPSQADGKGEKNEPKDGPSKTPADKADRNKNKSESASKAGEDKSNGDPQSKKDAGQGNEKSSDPGQGSAKDGQKSTEEKRQQSKNGSKEDSKAEKKQDNASSENKPSTQGETKPKANQGDGERKGQNENKQDSSPSARNASDKDIADLNRALQSKDAGQREKAKQQLQRIEKEATNPEARKQAGEALEKAGERDKPNGQNTPKEGNDSAGKPGEKRQEGEKSETPSGNDSTNDKGKGKNTNLGQENGEQGKKPKKGSTEEGQQGSPTSKDGTPGGGGDQRSGKSGPGAPPSPPKQPDKPRDHRAAQMQLEDFAKQVDKNILKEAGVSEEAWKKYLEAKRKQLTPPEKPRPETPNAPQQATQLPSMGGRAIQPGASGQADTQSPNRGQPPPGYRDSFRKFTQQMSK